MRDKTRIFRILEHYINVFRKFDVEESYGKNASIKIVDLNYSTHNKSLYLEAKIVLGDFINESVLDRLTADILIQDALIYLYPDLPIKISVDYDV